MGQHWTLSRCLHRFVAVGCVLAGWKPSQAGTPGGGQVQLPFVYDWRRAHDAKLLGFVWPSTVVQAQAVELVCRCDDVSDDAVELRLLKALLTAVTSTTLAVHGQALLLVVRACYNIFLTSRSDVNQATAKATLTQVGAWGGALRSAQTVDPGIRPAPLQAASWPTAAHVPTCPSPPLPPDAERGAAAHGGGLQQRGGAAHHGVRPAGPAASRCLQHERLCAAVPGRRGGHGGPLWNGGAAHPGGGAAGVKGGAWRA